jgi:hypothetical protein
MDPAAPPFPNLHPSLIGLPWITTAGNGQLVQHVSRKEASHGYFLLLAQSSALPPFCPADTFAGLTGTTTLWFA